MDRDGWIWIEMTALARDLESVAWLEGRWDGRAVCVQRSEWGVDLDEAREGEGPGLGCAILRTNEGV